MSYNPVGLFARMFGNGAVVLPLEGLHNGAEGLRDRWRARRRLARCAALADVSAEGSQVFATGIVRSLTETLIAPLSGQTCVGYRVRAWPQGSANPIDGGMHEIVQLRPFALEVGDVRVVIDGTHAVFAMRLTKLPRHNAEREESLLRRLGARTKRGWYGEALVSEGDRVTIGGSLVFEPPDVPSRELDYRASSPPARRIAGSGDSPLVIRGARQVDARALASAS